MSGTASKPNAIGGQLATARRGGIDMNDVWRAKEKIGPRATPSMIARYLGCCVEDVQRLMTPVEVKPKADTPAKPVEMLPARRKTFKPLTERDKQFSALWSLGVSYPEIARIMGCSEAWVWRWRDKLGLPPRINKADAA